MKIKDLRAATYNPRKITDKKLEMLGKSMREFGDLSGIVFNRRTGNLIGGHQRLKHLDSEWEIEGGFVKTPFGDFVFREVDWPEKKEKAANIAANKHGGEFDLPALKVLLADVDDLELTGFTADEIFVEPLKYEEKEIRPYRMTHILISFPPEKFIKIQGLLEKISKVEGVEIEQGSNG